MSAVVARARRLVVKVGSSLVTNEGRGLDHAAVARWAGEIATLRARRKEVVLVSSGAIAEGMLRLEWRARPKAIHDLQAAAAVGQMGLVQAYERAFSHYDLHTAQVLLTHDDLADRRRYLNARETIDKLLEWRSVPVINENYTVATTEIRYGDNDRLGARVATMMSADLLVLLSDIDGLYDAPPGDGRKVNLIPLVERITPQIEAVAGSSGSELSRGGMQTKIEAGKIATSAGTHMVIASGRVMHALEPLGRKGTGTWFIARQDPVTARKRWIAGTLEPKGAFTVDQGAAKALASGKSLLPAGVTRVEGSFERGDAVLIRNGEGVEIGRGLSAYSHQEAKAIIGCKSGEIEKILGYFGRAELIHRDDMVLQRGMT